MTDGKLEMIRDVLSWRLPADGKLAHISEIVKEQPPEETAPKAAAAKPRKRAVRVGSRAALWRELKRVAPKQAEGIGYTRASTGEMQAILGKVKKGR